MDKRIRSTFTEHLQCASIFSWAQGLPKYSTVQSLHSKNLQTSTGDRQVDNIMFFNLINTTVKMCTDITDAP